MRHLRAPLVSNARNSGMAGPRQRVRAGCARAPGRGAGSGAPLLVHEARGALSASGQESPSASVKPLADLGRVLIHPPVDDGPHLLKVLVREQTKREVSP